MSPEPGPDGDTSTPGDPPRIVRVHIRSECVHCQLSDGRLVSVPMAIAPALADAPRNARYQWRIVDRGQAMVWGIGADETRVTLDAMLAHPQAETIVEKGPGAGGD